MVNLIVLWQIRIIKLFNSSWLLFVLHLLVKIDDEGTFFKVVVIGTNIFEEVLESLYKLLQEAEYLIINGLTFANKFKNRSSL
jgi:hypothetical protein